MSTLSYSFRKDLLGAILLTLGILGLVPLLHIVPITIIGEYLWTRKGPVDWNIGTWRRVLSLFVPWIGGCVFMIWFGVRMRRKQRRLLYDNP